MNTKQKVLLEDYTPPAFWIRNIDLTFEIDDIQTKVTSKIYFEKNSAVANKATPLILDKDNYEITSLIANGMLLLPDEYEAGDNYLKLAATPDAFDLEITTFLRPDDNTSLEGFYRSGDILCTQCEAQGFRKITPFLDRPDVMATFTCNIIADKAKFPVLLSNGNLIKSGSLEKNRHFATWVDPFPKPSYLFALVAGKLECLRDQFQTKSGRTVDLRIYSEKEHIERCDHAMQSLKQAMDWDEQRFNLEYDLDLYQIVAINDFNAGAMENKGLNIFNAKYVIANPETATDEDFLNIQGVIGHEYFHNWTGNRVTLKNWFQLSLKEGLTVFRDQEFSSDLNSRGVKRISCIKNLRVYQFPEDEGPMAHPVRPDQYLKIDNFYTMTVYEKGAELVRMIHTLLGESDFQKGIKLYFEKFDGQAVTVEDFVSVMEEASSNDLSQFKKWYFNSGTPVVSMTRHYNEASSELTLSFNQEFNKRLHIPIKIGIIDSDGTDLLPQNKSLFELKKENDSITFKNIPKGCLPSIFRQFSAPVKIQTDFSVEELAVLMAIDTDDFNRWDAAQTLFIKEIKNIVQILRENKQPFVSENLISAFKNAMVHQDRDRAFLAKTIQLPLEIEIKDHFEVVDVDAIHQARQFLKKGIANNLKDLLIEKIEVCSKNAPSSLSSKSIGSRSLKNICMSYLGATDDPDMVKLIHDSYLNARTMTEELACFKILSNINPETKQKAVDHFYNKWENDTLVLDKWFSVQAASILPDTLNITQQLLNHKAFSIKNPNKVRSLIFMFAMFNPVHFHLSTGEGYQFIADRIIELDTINHQVAARLSSCFNHWKKYDLSRQEKIKKELERILSVQTLSSNVYEIVSKAIKN